MSRGPWEAAATKATLRVGDGRGFVVRRVLRHQPPLVVTAAHCLPSWPEAHPGTWGTLHRDLLGPLGGHTTVWADCLFVDPVGDVTVLGAVDNQELSEEADAYEKLVENTIPLRIADVVLAEPVWLLSLDGVWFSFPVDHMGMGLILSQTAQPIRAGMSGSPIVQRGAAVGLISNSLGGIDHSEHREGYEPRLVRHLPGWLLAANRVRREWEAHIARLSPGDHAVTPTR
ncbi:MAG: hypothetical protein ACREX3_00335 [Gammaproteobacteria bacterium]